MIRISILSPMLSAILTTALSLVTAISIAHAELETPHSGRIIVKLKSSGAEIQASSDFIQNRIESVIGLSPLALNVQKLAEQTLKDVHLVNIGQGARFANALNALRSDPKVEYAEPDYLVSAYFGPKPPTPTPTPSPSSPVVKPSPVAPPVQPVSGIPNDPGLANLWHLTSPFGAGLASLWKDDITGSRNILIATVDTGVDYTHPDLVANLYVNTAESGNQATDGIDNDANGFVDDFHGYNFAYGTNDPKDDAGHGTHVAGIIGASGNNAIGVVGVNWSARILPIKFLDSSGSGSTADGISGINYAVKMGAKVINCSWGSTQFSQALHDSIASAGKAGVLVIAAAGNDGNNTDTSPQYPSAYTDLDNLIAVAATDNQGQMASFSNYGAKSVHIAAPGQDIYSTYLGGTYKYLSGTSMATPVVTGVAALVWSQDPSKPAAWVKDRILKCGTPLAASVQSRTPVISASIVNAYNSYYGKNCK